MIYKKTISKNNKKNKAVSKRKVFKIGGEQFKKKQLLFLIQNNHINVRNNFKKQDRLRFK